MLATRKIVLMPAYISEMATIYIYMYLFIYIASAHLCLHITVFGDTMNYIHVAVHEIKIFQVNPRSYNGS